MSRKSFSMSPRHGPKKDSKKKDPNKKDSTKNPSTSKDPVYQDASSNTDVLIAIMGPTGAGKSTFINFVTGQPKVKVGIGLKSCTEHVEAVPVPRDSGVYAHFPSWPSGKRLVLVDNPGFDDTHLSDAEILERLAKWLAASYSQDMKLSGIIYLHDINTRRMNGSVTRNLSVFQKLCDKHAYSSIVLGTTQWSTVQDQHMKWAELRESELRTMFWRDMLLAGSTMIRLDDARPWLMLSSVYPHPGNAEVSLRIQEELVHLKMTLPQTKAAGVLREDLERKLAKLKTTDPSSLDTPKLQVQIKRLSPKKDSKKNPGTSKDPVFKDASSNTDVLIAVMGAPGAGKSTFINFVTGQPKAKVGIGLESCTKDVEAVPVPRDSGVYAHLPSWRSGQRLILVDTPGFDDTYLSDAEILKRLAEWLAASYSQGVKLAGIIYLHDINTRRMNGSVTRNLSVFQKLCGEHAYPSIVLGTTQWSAVKDEDMERAEACESELRAVLWKDMLLGGSTMRRLDNDRPWLMISDVYPRPGNATVSLRIQEELVHLKMTLPQTEAARVLREDLERKPAKLKTTDPSSPDTAKLQKQIKWLSPKKDSKKKNPDTSKDPVFQDASSNTDVLIAVMGPTGAGKSSFINFMLGGQPQAEVGIGLKSCTEHVKAVPVPRDNGVYAHFPSWPRGERLVLVDTPGFDDTYLSDAEILERLAKWLATSYSQDIKLAGIIYLHDINTRRMNGSATRNLSVFQKLCGEHAYPSIVLGTTQWSAVKDENMERAEGCEYELRTSFWQDMLLGGSTMIRLDNDRPWLMISDVYPRPGNAEVLLRIQGELVHLKMILPQTEAARVLREDLERNLAKLKTTDPSSLDTAKLQKQIKQLRASFGTRLRKFFRR